MKLACEEHEHLVVVNLRGELVRDEIQQFQNDTKGRLEKGARDFVIDLSQTEFIDSDGLEALLNLQARCAEKLGQVRLAACHDNVQQILTVTRLNRRFDQHATVDDAIKSLR
jgi:anti-anti-sigma factor